MRGAAMSEQMRSDTFHDARLLADPPEGCPHVMDRSPWFPWASAARKDISFGVVNADILDGRHEERRQRQQLEGAALLDDRYGMVLLVDVLEPYIAGL